MPSPSQTQTSSTGVEDRGTNDRGVSDRGTRTSTTAPGPTQASDPDPAAKLKSAPKWVPQYDEKKEITNHNHRPSGKWDELKQEPDSDFKVELIVTFKSPREAADSARYWELEARPLAAQHFDHYLKGTGEDFDEDKHLDAMLRTDEGVMYVVGKHILSRRGPSSTVVKDFLKISTMEQHYRKDEFEYSFGNIDRLDYQADLQNNKLRVYFKDRYEWHPYYPKIYPWMDGDVRRPSNIIHAAMVELKTDGANDFWMIGEAEVPLDPVLQMGSRDRPPPREYIAGDRRSEGPEGTKL